MQKKQKCKRKMQKKQVYNVTLIKYSLIQLIKYAIKLQCNRTGPKSIQNIGTNF